MQPKDKSFARLSMAPAQLCKSPIPRAVRLAGLAAHAPVLAGEVPLLAALGSAVPQLLAREAVSPAGLAGQRGGVVRGKLGVDLGAP